MPLAVLHESTDSAPAQSLRIPGGRMIRACSQIQQGPERHFHLSHHWGMMVHASIQSWHKQIRTGSWHGVEEPVSSRLGSEQAKPSTSLRTTKMDLLGRKTKLCSLGTEVSESTEVSSDLWSSWPRVACLLSMQLCAQHCSGAFPWFSSQQPHEVGDVSSPCR